jgi:lambda family phage portal protein
MGKVHHLRIVDQHGYPIKKAASDFEGAESGRRMSTWGTSSSGPSTAIYGSLTTLRARSRELTRNDPQISGAMDTLISNLIGSGISPRWQMHESGKKQELQQLWGDWTVEADADQRADFYGLESLVCRAIIEAGECFIRLRPRRFDEGYAVPLQLQVLEGDFVDHSYNSVAPNGNEIRFGIEVNKIGQRTAYWMFREHPGEYFLTSQTQFDRVRVPASQVIHVFKMLRPGQMRGLPWMTPIIVLMRELNQFDDAELVRKKTAALFGGFIETPPDEVDDAPHILGSRGTDDSAGNTVIDLEPGTFPELPPGYKVNFSEPADVGGSYEAFCKRQERRAARGLGGMTYEKYTGDLSGVNYSSIRAGNLEFQRQCKQFIYQVLAHQMCRPVAKAWLEQAILSGAIKLPGYVRNPRPYNRIKWTIDGWPWVDPLKDFQAAKGMVRAGFSTRTLECAERGLDVEEVDLEQAEDNTRADGLGLKYDTDGRITDTAGKVKDESTQNTED